MSLVFFIFAATIVALTDQWSKRAVLRHSFCVEERRVVQIRPVKSRRMRLRGVGSKALMVSVWAMACVAACMLYRSGAWFHSARQVIGLGMAIGGAAGNLMDAVRRDGVVDFIDVRGWPVFNLADVGIVVGLPAALWM